MCVACCQRRPFSSRSLMFVRAMMRHILVSKIESNDYFFDDVIVHMAYTLFIQ